MKSQTVSKLHAFMHACMNIMRCKESLSTALLSSSTKRKPQFGTSDESSPFSGCIFSSFTGDSAPLTFVSQARATVRRTAFRDFDLQEEIFDVSIGSSVRLENCTFTNITVPDNEYVSTSYSDWSTWQGDVLLTYYPDDDDGPDFDVERVRANDSTPRIPGADRICCHMLCITCCRSALLCSCALLSEF